MNKDKKTIIGFVAGCFVILAVFGYIFFVDAKKPGKYDDFASCITNSGAKFYGAYWCPHCQAQKAEFGKSAKKLPYIECELSTKEKKVAQSQIDQAVKDGKLTADQDPNSIGIYTRTQACTTNNIESYPTWIFADGSRVTGEQSFAELAAKTGCVAPAGSESAKVNPSASSKAQ